ncbi:MAG: 23S rRNA (adenine(2503)-C(2))-methyltransferase RlmN [Eggerthellaceae bacterium]|nr:23S rRNA (adenine(2503)-C(2))-methyltransferase RlmN [Eggerthellaceae bacterium]
MDTPIKTLSIQQLEDCVKNAGLPKFRAGQILSWIYHKNVSSFQEMTNLPQAARDQFDASFPIYMPTIVDKQTSFDGSRKYLLELNDGALVETVGLPSPDGRLTVCVSSQSGCAMACAFCATGKAGLTRSLVPGEFIDQIHVVQDDYDERVTNVVVMGQGEPFANYDATLAALRIMNHPKLLNIGARHITVSTCGLIKGINTFADEPEQFTLAISLHAAHQEVRDKLMPRLASQPLKDLRRALVSYTEKTGRRFSFEYALMKNQNDSEDDLNALIAYCRGLLCHVNLIPLNNIDDSPIKPASSNQLKHWESQLQSKGIAASIRASRGSDIAAACGQLAYKRQNN